MIPPLHFPTNHTHISSNHILYHHSTGPQVDVTNDGWVLIEDGENYSGGEGELCERSGWVTMVQGPSEY